MRRELTHGEKMIWAAAFAAGRLAGAESHLAAESAMRAVCQARSLAERCPGSPWADMLRQVLGVAEPVAPVPASSEDERQALELCCQVTRERRESFRDEISRDFWLHALACARELSSLDLRETLRALYAMLSGGVPDVPVSQVNAVLSSLGLGALPDRAKPPATPLFESVSVDGSTSVVVRPPGVEFSSEIIFAGGDGARAEACARLLEEATMHVFAQDRPCLCGHAAGKHRNGGEGDDTGCDQCSCRHFTEHLTELGGRRG